MSARKRYDRWGIEITRWNKDNIVAAIDCDCGQLAQNVRGNLELFKCAECGRCYHKERGEYLVKGNQ